VFRPLVGCGISPLWATGFVTVLTSFNEARADTSFRKKTLYAAGRRTFDRDARTTTQVLAVIREEADACIAAGFRSLSSLFTVVN